MGTPELSPLCSHCHRITSDHLEEVQTLKRPLHQVDPSLQAWLYAGEHLATLRQLQKTWHLYAAIEKLEGQVLRILPEPSNWLEAGDQMAALALTREGWTA